MPKQVLSQGFEVLADQAKAVKSQAKQATKGVVASAVKQVIGTTAGIDAGDGQAPEQVMAVETGQQSAGQKKAQAIDDSGNPLSGLTPQQMAKLKQQERRIIASKYRQIQEALLQEAIKRQQDPGKYITARADVEGEEDAIRVSQGFDPKKKAEKKNKSIMQRVRDMTMKGRGSGEKHRGMSG